MTPNDNFLPARQSAAFSFIAFRLQNLADRVCRVALLDYLSFYRSAYHLMQNLIEPGDTVVAMTDPPLCSILAMRAARKKGARLVNWLQDIYPEIAVELGVPLLKGPIAFGVCYWRDRSLKSAAVNVVVGEGMAERLVKRGLTSAHIKVIHNWTDDTEIVPIPHKQNQLRKLWGLEDKFVVGYSGNLGRAHDFDTILAASEQLRDDPRIIFLFIGSGHNLDKLANLVKSRGLARKLSLYPLSGTYLSQVLSWRSRLALAVAQTGA